MPNPKRLLARAPDSDQDRGRSESSCLCLLSFLVAIACLCRRHTCPEAALAALVYTGRLPLLSCLAQSLPRAPAVNLPFVRARLWFKLTAGPLLRGIQAVLQELAGSATGGRGCGMPVFDRRARFARGYPPTTLAALVMAGLCWKCACLETPIRC